MSESSLIVEVVSIDEITNHPNADRLDLATIKGWQCVVQKDQFKPGDKAVYIPIDSILPPELEAKIFGADSKVKLSKSRVKTIKLRGAISQGLVTTLEQVGLLDLKVGVNVQKILDITKYEPPAGKQNSLTGNSKPSRSSHPDFHKYTKLQNVKNYPKVFEDGEMVYVTEKIHGSNFRAGYVPFVADTIWKKVKKLFGFTESHEFVYGSHNVQLNNKLFNKGYYDKTLGKNIYAEAVDDYDLRHELKPGEVVYGEIYGDGIQKNYTYGCKKDERNLVLFDVMVDGEYLSQKDFFKWINDRQIASCPPVVYHGPFNLDKIKGILKGNSVLAPQQKTIEGGVCKPEGDESSYIGRKALKFINDDYLLKDNSDFH